jgi:protein-disulfide isomerase
MTTGSGSVSVIAYEDLQCPDSAAYARMLDEQLLPAYGSLASFEHREFPLPKHSWARQASIVATHFANIDVELGSAFRRYCYAHLREIDTETLSAHIRSFARAHAVDAELAVGALSDPAVAQQVEDDYHEGVSRGVTRTPTVFVNDQAFIEIFSFQQIAQAIETALESSGARE